MTDHAHHLNNIDILLQQLRDTKHRIKKTPLTMGKLLLSIQPDAQRQINRLDAYRTVVAYLDVDAVEIDDGVQRIERAGLPSFDFFNDCTGYGRNQAGRTSVPYISSRWPCISRTVMPRAYMDSILSSNPVQRV
jgi:hypothetical protein